VTAAQNVAHRDPTGGAAGLSVRELTAGYGGLAAVRNVTFDCAPGQVLALVGPNGAGKTTTLNAVVGLIKPMVGDIRVGDHSIRGLPVHRISRHGVALIPSDRGVFANLTVADHLRLALHSRTRKGRADHAWSVDDAFTLFPALQRRRTVRAAQLSGGEQQMLAITKAVMLGPRVLLIDELSLGLAPKLVQDMLAVIRKIVDETGMSVVLVEQHYELGLAIADLCVVLSHGEVAFAGTAPEILGQHSRLASVYLAHGVEGG
jgi:branched-chain amino acid transport system ATP-binding protein